MEYFTDFPYDSAKPTYFELLAQEKIRELLKPALQYVLSLYAPVFPRVLLPVINWSDEIYALLMTVIEWRYLTEWNASFSEHLYGFKRSQLRPTRLKSLEKLGSLEKVACIVFLVHLPYLKDKLNNYHESLEAETAFRAGSATRFQKLFIKLYPIIKRVFNWIEKMYQILYLLRLTGYFNPSLHVLHQSFKRLDSDDYQKAESLLQDEFVECSRLMATAVTIQDSLIAFFKMIEYYFKGIIKKLVPMTFVLLRFVEWWNSSEFPKNLNKRPVPPPPEPIKPHPQGIQLQNPNACPLCLKKLEDPTLTDTGYLFCSVCITDHYTKSKNCPITKKPVNELRRIYITDIY